MNKVNEQLTLTGVDSVFRIILTVILFTLAPAILADGHFTNWSDKTLCRLAQDSGSEEYRQAAIGRGLTCVTVNTTTTESTVKIEYDDRITILAASDVSEGTVRNVRKWMAIQQSNWFSRVSPDDKRVYPIIITIVGNSLDAAVTLETELCGVIKDQYLQALRYSRCRNSFQDSNCKAGKCYIAQYAIEGGASISSFRNKDGFHLMIMAGKRPSPSEKDYRLTVFHEAFHIYQQAHISTKNRDLFEVKAGRKTGDHNRNVPWWSEGTASYMGLLEHSRQNGLRSSYLKDHMKWQLRHYSGRPMNVVDAYFKLNTKLYNIDYGEDRQFGYTVAPWFVAYVIHHNGEESIFDFYSSLNELGFEASFIKHFGKPYRDYIDEFEVFLKQPMRQLLKIIP